jgi:hypothetical protein
MSTFVIVFAALCSPHCFVSSFESNHDVILHLESQLQSNYDVKHMSPNKLYSDIALSLTAFNHIGLPISQKLHKLFGERSLVIC